MKRNWIYIVAIVILLAMAWYFHTIIAYILVAGVISLIGEPVIRLLLKIEVKGRNISRAAAASLTIFGLLAFFGGLISAFIPMVADEARKLSNVNINEVLESIQGPIQSAQDYINQFKFTEQPIVIENEVKSFLTSVFDLSDVGNSLSYVAGLTGDIFIAFFAITFITFFFLKDQGLFKGMIMTLVPSGYEERFGKVMSKSKELLTRYFIGIIVQIAIVMVVISIGLSIVGIDNAILIGFLAGLFNVIPYVGPMIGAALGIIIGLSTNGAGLEMTELLWLTGKMMIVFGVMQTLDNIVLQPLIYSQSVKAHPLEIFLVILMAGNVAGIAGMILAIPAYSIGRVFVGEFFNQFKVVKALTGEV
ncbi:MAG: AI-2E family transporter [Flavobacteriales bacterium]|nr:AI-2E family transporter [Flavobacteriales bacterium]MCB9205462.1 AI-2E family transporter [Flavobacteriales bacterium]